MMKPRCIAFLLLGAFSIPMSAAEKPIDPHNPPDGRFSDDWAEVYLAGGKVGYSHSTMTREADRILTSTAITMEISRAEHAIKIKSEESTIETLAGVPVSFGSSTDMSMMKSSTTGTVENGKVTIVQSQFGMKQSQTFDYPTGALMTWGSFRESLIRGFEPGTHYAARVYAPQLRLDDAVTATTTIGEWGPFDYRGQERRGLQVEVVMETPIGSMSIRSWVDRDGMPLKAQVPAPGLGNLEIVTTDQATALADFVPPELFLNTVIKVDRSIDRKPAQRVRYRITANRDEVELGRLPDTGAQTVLSQTDRAVELVVSRQEHKPMNGGDKLAKPPADCLDGNLMINIDDPELVALARKAGGDETESFALGDRLRRFVSDYVTSKNLNVGFATASEVCRHREGDCSEHGVLLAALGRLNGLPSRVAVGVVYLPSFGGQENVFGYHMWTQFLIDGRWVDFDAALGESECSPTRIAFATSSLKNTGLADLSLPLLTKIGAIDIEILDIENK